MCRTWSDFSGPGNEEPIPSVHTKDKDKYNVVLHQSAFLPDAAEKKAESAGPSKNQTIKK
jgi:hypothetical protein